jgi:DNA repair photolyase
MSLKKPTGNMYPFIDWIWNPIRGKCFHNCKYCYVKRAANKYKRPQTKLRLVDSELRTNLGSNNFIFICSGCDLFAENVPFDILKAVIDRTLLFPENKYLLHTKNPERVLQLYSLIGLSTDIHKICTTIETNRYLPGVMKKSPHPHKRAFAMKNLADIGFETMVTIEPVMKFDHVELVKLIRMTKAAQVNIGADSDHKKNNLPEPHKEELLFFIKEIEQFTTVFQKKNLRRLLK